MAELDAVIVDACRPWQHQIELLQTIPGVRPKVAEVGRLDWFGAGDERVDRLGQLVAVGAVDLDGALRLEVLGVRLADVLHDQLGSSRFWPMPACASTLDRTPPAHRLLSHSPVHRIPNTNSRPAGPD
jgi:hypothetical protein